MFPPKSPFRRRRNAPRVRSKLLNNAHSTKKRASTGLHHKPKEMSSSSKGGESGIKINSTLIKKGTYIVSKLIDTSTHIKRVAYYPTKCQKM